MSAKFSSGRVTATPQALDNLSKDEIQIALGRHVRGDWGDVCPEDRAANERALLENSRLFSVYHTDDGTTFWIITEADRSLTTVLLPGDF